MIKKFLVPLLIISIAIFTTNIFAGSKKSHKKDLTYMMTDIANTSVKSLKKEIIIRDIKTDWSIQVYNNAPKHKSYPDVEEMKKRKTLSKKLSGYHNKELGKNNGYIEPVIERNFQGNQPKGWHPSDNRIAVSKNGFIVSVINSNLAVFDSNGEEYVYITLSALVNNLDEDLSGTLYDPTVLYDPGSDRFILVFLHSFKAATSKVIVGFSKSDDPRDSWNFYVFSSETDLESQGHWFDYPNIGVSAQDFFVTGNMYNTDGDFDYSLILQIKKSEAYNGESLRYQIWSDFKDSDGYKPFTVVPISSGNEWNYGPGIYLISTYSVGWDRLQLIDITDDLSADSESLELNSVSTNPYSIGGNGFILERTEKLNVGDCRVRSGVYVNGTIHFVYQSDYDSTGWNGINYNRLDVETITNRSVVFANPGFDYCYPAVSWFGLQEDDKSAIIGFLCSSDKIYPQIRVVSFDNQMNPSPSVLVKRGENYFGDFDEHKKTVRWGDYSGMVRQHNSYYPIAWMAGEYGRSDKKRGTWIAEISGRVTSVKTTNGFSKQTLTPQIYPNPSSDLVNITFHLKEKSDIEIRICDLLGRLVKLLYRDVLLQGENNLTFSQSNLSSGTYFVQIIKDNKIIHKDKLIVIH